ncbi:MAG: cysteine--tRNA ligase [Vampirovibrionales bacterium]|nr:cysteine--tRNA ligase [Vampirovibrionales bacterium]
MAALIPTFYNTLTRQLEPFKPRELGKVSLYVCGPTVYDDPHLGHARCYITWDVLVRLLRALAYEVIYARNITDVDDKILNRAQERGVSPSDLAKHYETRFEQAMTALNILPATISPHATEHIPKMLEGIQHLMAQGFAYATPQGDVYFDIAAYNAAFDDTYPALSRQSLEQKQAGARIEVNTDKKNPHDFALWKIVQDEASAHALSWPAPWTSHLGRPGWHIECSAMNAAVFGAQIDIHAGGADLMFPHHDCEIAQSQAWHGSKGTPFARLWLHNGFVNVSGEKMSKSLNNFKTVFDVLDRYSANAIRYFLLQHHYRSPVDFTDAALQAAENRIHKLKTLFDGVMPPKTLPFEALTVLAQDMDTPKTLALMNTWVNDPETRSQAWGLWHLLGFGSFQETVSKKAINLDASWQALLQERQEAKASKNWARADAIRQEFFQAGYVLNDHKDGTTTYEPL